MASCSFPPSFIMLSLCTSPSLPGRELLFLSMQTATHPHVWVTSCVLCSGTLQTPPTFFLSALLSSSYSQRPNMTRITHYTRGTKIWQSQICADEYLLSKPTRQLFNSQFIDRTLCFSCSWIGFKENAIVPAENVAPWRLHTQLIFARVTFQRAGLTDLGTRSNKPLKQESASSLCSNTKWQLHLCDTVSSNHAEIVWC